MPPRRLAPAPAPALAPAPAHAPATTVDARFEFAYVGTPAPTTLADQVQAVTDNATMLVAPNHVLAKYIVGYHTLYGDRPYPNLW